MAQKNARTRAGEAEIIELVINAEVMEPDARDGFGGGPGGRGPTLVGGPSDGEPSDLELASRLLNDLGNAERLIVRHGDDLLAVDEMGWCVWDGWRWLAEAGPDEAQKLAHLTAKAIFNEADALQKIGEAEIVELIAEAPLPALSTDNPSSEQQKAYDAVLADHNKKLRDLRTYWKKRVDGLRKFASNSGNKSKLDAMLSQAQPYLRVPPRELDAHPFLLNVGNGTLEMGEADKEGTVEVALCSHRRDHKITRLAEVKYDPEATTPEWDKFLKTVQPDPEMRGFLQRFFGYCLTGDTGEQVMAIAHGVGANGKSTMLETLSEVMGDYAVTVPITSFLYNDHRGGGDARPDLARLPGARLVLAAEPEVGARFSESTIKSVTGGERMAVRHLFKDMFEFVPAFKLIVSCNIKPNIRGSDDGIWRRLLIIPFEVVIPKDERVNQAVLKGKLLAERNGILNWALDGYRMWREEGLRPPLAIIEATDEYRTDTNPVGAFMQECVEEEEWSKLQGSPLYQNYCRWAKAQSLEPLKLTSFGRRLRDMGYHKEKGKNVFYLGISMKAGWDEGLDQVDAN